MPHSNLDSPGLALQPPKVPRVGKVLPATPGLFGVGGIKSQKVPLFPSFRPKISFFGAQLVIPIQEDLQVS